MSFPSSRACRRPSSVDPDLNEIVNEVAVSFQRRATKVFNFHFRPGVIPALDLDREQIKRVLINLLDNAVAAVRETARSS